MIVLDKLVALRCNDPNLLGQLRELACNGTYASVLAEVERRAGDGIGPSQLEAAKLYQQIAARNLLDLFRDDPKLSEVRPDDLLALASFCDVRPDAKTMFQTDDPVFMRLVDLTKQGPVVVTKLVLDDFSQFAIIASSFPPLWENLHDLAEGASWTSDMLAVEQFLSDRLTLPGYPPAASLAQAAATAATPDGLALAYLMLTAPRFSGILAEEVVAYDSIRTQLPDPDSLIDKKFTPTPSPAEKGRALAKLALERLPPNVLERIERGYMLRLDALRELTRRRIFVKRDIFEHVWPDLYDRMRRDFAGIVQFEKQIQHPETCTEDELTNLRPYLRDERLVRVLNLQPYFGHLMDGSHPTTPIVQPRPSENGVPQATGAPTLKSTSSGTKPVPPVSEPPTERFPADQIAATPFLELPQVHYDDVFLAVERLPGTTDDLYRVILTTNIPDGPRNVVCEDVLLNWSNIREQVRSLHSSGGMRGSQTRSANLDYMSQLKKLGLVVYDSLFRKPIRDELLVMLGSTRNLRLNWVVDHADPMSAVLPWECLYVPPAQVSFLALTRKYSLIRRSTGTGSMPVSPIGQKLRMIFVTAAPPKVAPLPGIEQELATVESVLGATGKADLRIVRDATVEEVNHIMREFRPHVFHFSGHGVISDDGNTGGLIFQAPGGDAHLVTAEQFSYMLYENNVSLALLNGCDTGVSPTNDAVSGVASALIKAGVPAVVATMREIEDAAAARFTREFYRCLVSGFTIEGCMGEARKALSFDNCDWSAYALFMGSADLDKLRISGPARSQH